MIALILQNLELLFNAYLLPNHPVEKDVEIVAKNYCLMIFVRIAELNSKRVEEN
jgi:hypothetical protein